MHPHITKLIDQLATIPSTDDTFNPYAQPDPNNAIRRANLGRYLQQMLDDSSHILMVMEAPGYRGCRLTGIPVTSRKVMLEGIPPLGLFGQEQGYQATDDVGFEAIYSEQSATILWETCTDLQIKPLLWNTFPWHPHQAGNRHSNRKPRTAEILQGNVFLSQVIELFKPTIIVAVGNVADGALTHLKQAHTKVRHPAQGGKHDFVRGLQSLFAH